MLTEADHSIVWSLPLCHSCIFIFGVPKVVGSNPGTIYWMDIFHIFCFKICYDVCLKRPKINDKRGRGWPILLKKSIEGRSQFTVVSVSISSHIPIFTFTTPKINDKRGRGWPIFLHFNFSTGTLNLHFSTYGTNPYSSSTLWCI